MSKLVRKNIRMGESLANWYEVRAVELGVSQSNLMVMALADYVKQDKAMVVMSNMQHILDGAKELSSDQESQKPTK